MAACLSRSVGLPPIFPGSASSLKMEESSGSVLRRTLSATEMCSKIAIKRTGSVENLQSLISGEEGNGSKAFEAIWSSIQKKEDVEPEVYVHPMVKRSASSLSEKSLEICTESLGSETGAETLIGDVEEVQTVSRSKRTVATAAIPASFPPPLPSLGNRDDGSNVQMRCHRRDGRLVVEAVSVPSRNCFKAERQGGRLLLTFSGDDDEESSDEEEEEEREETEEVSGNEMKTMMKYVDNSKFLFLTRRMNKVVPTVDDSVAKTWTPAPPTALVNNAYVYSWRRNETVPRGGGATEAKQGHAAPLLFWRGRCVATS